MTDKTEGKNKDTFQRLIFRNQFLIGPKPFEPNQYWSCNQLLHGLHLSIHRDLPFTSESQNGVAATLIGIAIDPLHPQHTESDILKGLLTKASDIKTLIDSSTTLVGRWVVVFQSQNGTYLFTDPCGFRQVFYYSDGRQFWFGSQPEIIKADHPLDITSDEALLNFLMSPERARNESQWVSTKTIYENCFHLLPNHYLDAGRFEQIRFYPSKPITQKEPSEIIESAGAILRNTISAITGRYDVLMALSGGLDSRVLLAASRDVSDRITYFVDRKGDLPEDHPDIWVSKSIAEKLNINHIVMNSSDDLPGWFVSLLSHNVTGARVLPKTRSIYDHFVTDEKRIKINGNASEICRNPFNKYYKLDLKDIGAEDITRLFGFKSLPEFAVREIDAWRKGLDCDPIEGFNILELLHWEQKNGNWGALFPAEQDIAAEQLSPFNCRLLIETMSSVPRRLRAAPDYPIYLDLIRSMWPEALSVPINPAPKGDFIGAVKRIVKPYLPSPIYQVLYNKMKLRR